MIQSSVLKHFEAISKIPRSSGNEKAVSDHIRAYVESLGLSVIQDEYYNLIIKKPGSLGRENDPTVMLQGHLDMVCDKTPESTHDFTKDPIDLILEGDWIHADQTSLGADNGIGVAYTLAILEDQTHSFPPLEVVLTTCEENGCIGASRLNTESLTAKYLINLNSENEQYIYTSCSGGMRLHFATKIHRVAPLNDFIPVEIRISGLQGGHSGEDIHLRRGNPIKIMSEFLFKWYNVSIESRLISIDGGIRENTIPHDCVARLMIPASKKVTMQKECWYCGEELVRTYQMSEPEARISVDFPEAWVLDDPMWHPISADDTGRILSFLNLCPNGVMNMSQNVDGLVETSSNFGIVSTSEDVWHLNMSSRSYYEVKNQILCNRLSLMAELNNIEFSITGSYPGWQNEEPSVLCAAYQEAYKSETGREIPVHSVHAGVECGVFVSKMPHLDAISIGPDIKGIHSYREKVSVSSTEKVYRVIVKTLEALH